MTAATLLDMARDPASWQPRHDCRPAMRRAVIRADADGLAGSTGAALFLRWLVDRFNADGSLAAGLDRRKLQRRSGIPESTFTRYLALAHRLGLVDRAYAGVQVTPGEWRRVVIITAAARFRQQAADLRNAHGEHSHIEERERSSPRVAVGAYTSVVDARASDDQSDPQPSPDERALLRGHWPRLARSRKHVPDCQPSALRWIRPTCGKCQTVHNWHELCPGDRLAADVPEPAF